jgi:tetratricopeptide (TPR) repeat protein
MSNLAHLFATDERWAPAERLYAQARALLRALNLPFVFAETLYDNAYMCYRRRNYAQAQKLLNEALRISGELDRKDIQFQAQVLTVLVRARSTPLTRAGGVKKLERLLAQARDEKEQAWANHALAIIQPTQANWGRNAARLYRKLHTRTPRLVYRRFYKELGGANLTEPPLLPDLPTVQVENPLTLDELITEVNETIERFKPPKLKIVYAAR